MVTSFVFRVRSVPAALYKALGGFATNGVNITKLESYILDGNFSSRAVLRRYRGPSRPAPGAAGAWKNCRFFSREVRILGVYPASAFRYRR